MPRTPQKLNPRSAARIARSLAWCLAVSGLLGALAVTVGHTTMRARIDRLTDAMGLDVRIAAIELGFGRPTAVYHASLVPPAGTDAAPQAVVRRVQADLDLSALLAGRRRPGEVSLKGLAARLRIDQNGLAGLDDVLKRWRDARSEATSPSTQPSRPLALQLEHSRLFVEIRHPLMPPIDLLFEGVDGTATRIAGETSVTFRADTHIAGQNYRGSLQALRRNGRWVQAAVALDRPITVPMAVAGRPFTVSVSGLSRNLDRGETTVKGLVVSDGATSVSARTVLLRETASPASRRKSVPNPRDIVSVSVSDGRLKSSRGVLSMYRLDTDLAWREGHDMPYVSRLVAKNASLDTRGLGLTAAMGGVDLAFRDCSTDKLIAARHDYGALTEVVVESLASLKLDAPSATAMMSEDKAVSWLPRRLQRLLRPTEQSPTRDATPNDATSANRPSRTQRLVRLVRDLPLSVNEGLVEFQRPDGGPLLTLEDLRLKLSPQSKGQLGVAVDASIVRNGQATGQVDVDATLDAQGSPIAAKGRVAGQDFAHMASTLSKYISVPPEADLDIRFDWTAPSGETEAHVVTGSAVLNNFGFEAWRISHVPVTNIHGQASFTMTYDPTRGELRLRLPKISLAEASMEGRLEMVLPRPGRKAKFSGRLHLPHQDCAAVRRSIPPALLPRLKGLKVKGRMWFDAQLAVDMDKPKELTLEVLGDMNACQVLTLGDEIDLSKLRGRKLVHHPVEPKRGVRTDISVGPGTHQWVPSRLLPRFVKAAAIVTEDRGFRGHGGVRWVLVRRALKLNFKHGRFVYGGSTITQQLVKNLYLTREKTLGRKLEEAIVAMQMEREFSKDDILTMYVNVVEYGPDIYGIKKASRHYFGKQPRHLSPLEAAFIMGLKPWPAGGFKQWLKGSVNDYWVKRLGHILSMMHRREGAISAEQVEEAAPYRPTFRPRGASYGWGKPYKRVKAKPKADSEPAAP